MAFVEEKLERGRRLRRNSWGQQADGDLESALSQELVPETASLVDAYNYGEAWARGDLTPKERTVCILVALMCRGHMRQLKTHIGYALNLGLSQREICEVFSQAGWYRGWPYVEEALEQAKAVFEEGALPNWVTGPSPPTNFVSYQALGITAQVILPWLRTYNLMSSRSLLRGVYPERSRSARDNIGHFVRRS